MSIATTVATRRISACRCCGRVGLVSADTGTCAAPENARAEAAYVRVRYCQRVAERRLAKQRRRSS